MWWKERKNLFRLWARKSFQYNLIQSALYIWIDGCYIHAYIFRLMNATGIATPPTHGIIFRMPQVPGSIQSVFFFFGEAAQWSEICPWQPRYFAHCTRTNEFAKGNKCPSFCAVLINAQNLYDLFKRKQIYI